MKVIIKKSYSETGHNEIDSEKTTKRQQLDKREIKFYNNSNSKFETESEKISQTKHNNNERNDRPKPNGILLQTTE